MSSEEAALRRLEAAYVNLGGLALSRYDGVVDDLTKARAEKAAALDNYRKAIERRVLAQQPCYGAWSNGEMNGPDDFYTCVQMDALDFDHLEDWPKGARCPTCTARQPQETSG